MKRTNRTGVYKREMKDGDVAFYIKYQLPNGKQKQERVGTYNNGYRVETVAEIRADKVRKGAGHEGYFEGPKDMLLEDGLKKWLELAKADGLKQTKSIQSHFKNHFLPKLGQKLMGQITPDDLNMIKLDMIERNLSAYSINQALGDLKRVYNRLKEAQVYNGENPTDGVRFPKQSELKERLRYLEPDEAKGLLTILKEIDWQTWAQATISLLTGMRQGEIMSLEGHWIDLKRGLITIRDTKNGEDRDIKLSKPVKDILEQLEVKRYKSIWTRKKFADWWWTKALKQSKLNEGVTDRRDRVVFHTFRHTFATWLAMQGATLREIQYKMGHKSISQTERYAKYMPSQQNADIEDRLADLVTEQKEPAKVIKLTG